MIEIRLLKRFIFIVLFLSTSSSGMAVETVHEGSELIGTRAQEWEVQDWFNSKPLRLEDLKGKVLLVRFWTAPACPFCAASAPALNEFYEKYHSQGLEVIGFYHHKLPAPLNSKDVQKYMEKFGFKFPVAIDYNWKTLKHWWLDDRNHAWTSVSFLIDKKGAVRHVHPGGQYVKGDKDYTMMKAKIEELLKEDSKVEQNLYETILAHSVGHTVVSGDNLYDIAKKYRTTVDLLKKLNHLKKDMIYPRVSLKVPQGTFSIRVDKSENVLTLLLDGKRVKEYRVATGKENNTPVGRFKIVNKVENPIWYKAGAAIPPDSPENFLGTRWMGFDLKEYGIHGTVEPETIGQQVSSGCVRMLNADVEELFSLILHGTEVVITN